VTRLVWPFWNAEERRLRALVRLVSHGALFGVPTALLQLLLFFVVQPLVDRDVVHLLLGVLGATVALGATALACRWLDRRRLRDLGLRLGGRWALDCVVGFLLGAALMAAIAGAEHALGWATYRPVALDVDRLIGMGTGLVVFIGVAISEELVFRGYHITNLAEGMRGATVSARAAVIGAVLLSSLVFGAAHAFNPNASVISTLNIAMAGVLLAIGYLTTGELALPIGLHLSWNFVQNLFAMPVSGQSLFHYAAAVSRHEDGPDWITGGAFGPEAGLTGLIAMCVGATAILGYSRVVEGRTGLHPALLGDPPRVL